MRARTPTLLALAGQVLVVACASSLDLSTGALPEQVSVVAGRASVTVRWSAPPGPAGLLRILEGTTPDLSGATPVPVQGNEYLIQGASPGQTTYVQLVGDRGETGPLLQAVPLGIQPVNVPALQFATGAPDFTGFAESLVVVGDVDGDGIVDVAVGAPETSGGTGAVYLFQGGSSFPGTPQVFLGDPGTQGHFGATLVAGDFDGDGHADLVVGAPDEACTAGPACGKVFLLRGVATAPYLAPVFSQTGSSPNGRLGATLTAGDLTGNGLSDLAAIDGQLLRLFPGERQEPLGLGPEAPPTVLTGPLFGVSSGACLAIAQAAGGTELALGLPRYTTSSAQVLLLGLGNQSPVVDPFQPGTASGLVHLGVTSGSDDWITLDETPGSASLTRRLGVHLTSSGFRYDLATTASGPAFHTSRFAALFDGGVLLGDPEAVVGGTRSGQLVYFPPRGSPLGTNALIFSAPAPFAGGLIGQTVDVGDLNGDGIPDVVATAPGIAGGNVHGAFGFVPGLPATGPAVSAGVPLRAFAGAPASPVGWSFLDPVKGIGHDCLWTWGDSVVEAFPGCQPASPSHVYRSPGRYQPVLRVIAADGRIGEASTTVYVTEGP